MKCPEDDVALQAIEFWSSVTTVRAARRSSLSHDCGGCVAAKVLDVDGYLS